VFAVDILERDIKGESMESLSMMMYGFAKLGEVRAYGRK
jgi:hypothetical protein